MNCHYCCPNHHNLENNIRSKDFLYICDICKTELQGNQIMYNKFTGEVKNLNNTATQTQASPEFISNLQNGYANAKTEQARQEILQVAKSKGIQL